MRFLDGRLSSSPTDLANFLACRHKTELDLLVAEGRLKKPTWVDPLAEILRKRGDEHEGRYVESLRAEGLEVLDLGATPREERTERTVEAMHSGVDVIVQAVLANDRWLGYADLLRKVDTPSPTLGAWSYEAHDTKLARDTRGGTILQLCVYTELLGGMQERMPEQFHVVTPVGGGTYRFDDFGAFYRQTKTRFLEFVASSLGRPDTSMYPDPVDHCAVCRWSSRCAARRRTDDHLSLVAGIGRHHRVELCGWNLTTRTGLAAGLPADFKPARGAKATYERLQDQARLQVKQDQSGQPEHELLPIAPDFGLTQLPEPRPGDLFLDLEGDPFGRPVVGARPGESSREYLFGVGRVEPDGSFTYRAHWAFNDAEEHAAFEAVMNDIMAALEDDPAIHIYHYAPYEPSAFKRLMGRYAVREADVDRLLRGRRFVDLYAIVRHALRAGVEKYSIKNLEPLYTFLREVPLDEAGDQRRVVEIALEIGDAASVPADVRGVVEGYNKDDCRSAAELRRWLESLRDAQATAGVNIPRPRLTPEEPSEEVSARQQRVDALRGRLLKGVSPDPGARSPEEQARYLLAYLLDWHYREDKVVWWEYFRLLGLSDEELRDEPAAVSELEFVEDVEAVRNKRTGRPTGSMIKRYRYPRQECEIRAGDVLTLRDETTFGEVMAADRSQRMLDIKRSRGAEEPPVVSAFTHDRVSPGVPAASLFRLGEQVAREGLGAAPHPAIDLLLRQTNYQHTPWPQGESTVDYAVRLVGHLAGTTLPIQGPPGSGKTFTGARMICELVRQGKRVGVTATSHKVIRNLLRAVAKEAAEHGPTVRLGHRCDVDDESVDGIAEIDENGAAHDALAGRVIDVLGGTAWLWSRPDFANAVDVLFIDEAGQMSLANALAVSQAAGCLVLLGDPQQLEQPQKGSHPDGTDVSALDHVLGAHKTMPAECGLFLPVTWRLAPAICDFTSEVFYEGKLTARAGLERQRLTEMAAGLYIVDVEHDGCRNASEQEAEVVASLVDTLLRSGAGWIDAEDRRRNMSSDDVLVVAAYNAQVSRVQERLARAGGPAVAVRVGTVDRFQGQEAPVVIYSMATSRPEDAPRGMEFLYSLNRLNVATSRAKCVCMLVASPRLFEPECRTPRQMQLANALARYREVAQVLTVER